MFCPFFCNKNGCILSDPTNLIVFSSCRIFSNSDTLASIVPKGPSKPKACTVCILDTSSLVNTLAKNSFSSLTFSVSLACVYVSSVFRIFPFDDLGLVFCLMFFQNLFGSFFTFNVILFS